MFTTALQNSTFNFLDKETLVKLKLKAMRAGVWYRALPRIDRVLVDLTIKVTDNIRSSTLAKSVRSVMSKLDRLLENRLSRAIREVGLPLAQKLSTIAQTWGNVSANKWSTDLSFIKYLAVMQIND